MTREEWYRSIEFMKCRRFHNRAFRVGELIGELYEELQILNEELGPLMHDKIHLYERQLQVLRLEADRLRTYGMEVGRLFEMMFKNKLGYEEKDN